MKIYFCGSITGGQRLIHLSQKIIKELKSMGHAVLTEHVGKVGIIKQYRKIHKDQAPRMVFRRDMDWLKNETQLVVAEVSTPSTGVGYEISYALEKLRIPVLALYRKDRKNKVSFMVLGNNNKNLVIKQYQQINDIKTILKNYFKNFNKEYYHGARRNSVK